jgi:hypothetical protein
MIGSSTSNANGASTSFGLVQRICSWLSALICGG